MKLTTDVLSRAVSLQEVDAGRWLPHIQEAAERASLTTVKRLAAFLAQTGHESAGFRFLRELWGPTPTQLRYEGRRDLGNVRPGDGFRYRGRGLIQVTGRANYTTTGRSLGIDLVNQPGLLEQPRWAALSAADYWTRNNLNNLVDSGDFKGLTRRINGGLNGYADRLARYQRALEALA